MSSRGSAIADAWGAHAEMAVIFSKPSNGEFFFQADFVQLAFPQLREPVPITSQLFNFLSGYGLRTADVRFDAGSGSLADAVWTYQLTGLRSTLRIRLERFELHCYDAYNTNVENIRDLGLGVLNILRQLDIKFRTHALTVSFHTLLQGITARDFISRFVSRGPENLGPNLGHTIIYYYGSSGKQLSRAVTFEPSVRIRDGLFAKIHGTWDGAETPIGDIPTLADRHVRDVLESFGLRSEAGVRA